MLLILHKNTRTEIITRQAKVSVKRFYLVHMLLHNLCCLVERGYSPEGSDSWGRSSPVAVLPVFTWSKVVHLSPVVGLLIQKPVTVHHVTGVDVRCMKAVHDVRAVFREFYHLTSHISPVI